MRPRFHWRAALAARVSQRVRSLRHLAQDLFLFVAFMWRSLVLEWSRAAAAARRAAGGREAGKQGGADGHVNEKRPQGRPP
eukprot:7048848-Pyramimonas_sp.AAC.1